MAVTAKAGAEAGKTKARRQKCWRAFSCGLQFVMPTRLVVVPFANNVWAWMVEFESARAVGGQRPA